jgi:hypothetical protein
MKNEYDFLEVFLKKKEKWSELSKMVRTLIGKCFFLFLQEILAQQYVAKFA